MKEKVGSLKRDLTPKLNKIFHKWFGKSVELKKYLYEICDAGSTLLFLYLDRVHTV